MVCCPFHEETRPSCSISPKGLFHCFSCGEKGYITKMVSLVYDTDLNTSKSIVRSYTTWEDSTIKEKISPRDPPPPPTGHIYLVERGIPWSIQKEMEIWVDHDTQEIVFPVRHIDGKIVGEKRRSIINPRSFRHIGRKSLYGAYYITSHVKNKVIYIVEGEVDALALLASGEYAVALMGAYMTDELFKILHSLRPSSIVLALDADSAGKRATEKLFKKLSRIAVPISIATYPDGVKDPAEALAVGARLHVKPYIHAVIKGGHP